MAIERHEWIPRDPDELELGHVEGKLQFVHGHASFLERVVLEGLVEALQPDFNRFVQAKIRCVDVKKGRFPCEVPGWHLDHVETSYHEAAPERHAIWVSSVPTLFCFNQYMDDLDGIPIDPEYVYTYGRDWHRPSVATADHRRLMVRLSEGDVVRPRNKSTRR